MTAPATAPVPGRVSFVLPAWNAAGTVASAIESCLAQDWGDVEVVVVDDGSTDGTSQVLRAFGGRIRLVERANGGVAAARNSGVRVATGEFLAWMDNDDLADPRRARIGVAVMRARPDVVLVCSDFSAFASPDVEIERSHIATYYSVVRRLGGMRAILPEAGELPAEAVAGEGPVAYRAGPARELLLEGNFVHPPTAMMRRTAFDRAGFLDESLRLGSEYEHAIRVAGCGRVAYIEQPLLRYRRSDSQLSSWVGSGGRVERETVRVLDKVRREDPELAGRLRGTIRRRLASACVEAAGGIGSADRLLALRYLARGVSLGPRPGRALVALARIAIPRRVVAAVRGLLRRQTSGAGAYGGAAARPRSQP